RLPPRSPLFPYTTLFRSALLYPVRHGSEEAQQDLLRIKLRDSLVRARVGLINSLRFTLKSLGYTIANPSTERFYKVVQSALPESDRKSTRLNSSHRTISY